MKCCFLPCFASSSKSQNHFSKPINNPNPILNPNPIQPIHQNTVVQESIDWISESKIQNEEQSQSINKFDFETKEEKTTTPKSESKDNHDDDDEEYSESLFSVSIGFGKPLSVSISVSADENAENEVNSTPIKLHSAKHAPDDSTLTVQLKESKSEQKPKPNPNEAKDLEEKGKAILTNRTFVEYRYRDCSDDGYDNINLDDDDPSESLFSLPTNYNSRNQISVSSNEKEFDNEVSSKIRVPSEAESEGNNIPEDVCSVLNSIENVSQGKVKMVKATVVHSIEKDKENINILSAEPNLKLSSSNRKRNLNRENGVDTSLSCWLVEPENINNTPKGRNVNEDRPILGALTVEEIRKYSPKTCSRSHSPEDIPIIGTLGSYWSHSRESRRSSKSNKYGKDGKEDWNLTTIKTKLEPAFEASVTQN